MTPEEFIKEYTMGCSNDITPIGNYDHTYQEWLTPEQALRAVELAREELINKACEWLQEGGSGWYLTSEFGEDVIDFVELAEDFRKAMEE